MIKKIKNYSIAIENQSKFEFYFIALVFTILALSIQTCPKIDTLIWRGILEFGAWIFLAISGLSALFRLEWLPIGYKHQVALENEQEEIRRLKMGSKELIFDEKGEILSQEDLQKYMQELKVTISERDVTMDKIEMKVVLLYHFHKWTFVLGLVALIASRIIANLPPAQRS